MNHYCASQCVSMEQKLKQVSEEMSCQRHNAESCRRALEQKVKDQEKERQKVCSLCPLLFQTL